MTLKLHGNILVDVPPTVCLPSLKTLQLRYVTYLNEDSLRLLLSHCLVLEDLLIARRDKHDNLRAVVVNFPSLQRLSLQIVSVCSSDDGYVIVTPCLRYFKIVDHRDFHSYLMEPMPKLEEADIHVLGNIGSILESITSVRRLSLGCNGPKEFVHRAGIVFNQLEHLNLSIYTHNWSDFLVWMLGHSPKLRALNLSVGRFPQFAVYQPVKWSSVPECLLRSLETFEFKDYTGTQEQRDFLSFFFKHASCLRSASIIRHVPDLSHSF
ncbi:unnamed protein product [Microthlaspi erraticum]|uniref:Uncharacterized protein n=1 Tax=Microthlaspi erraticum TaxID=1685480 RepID=A0A6D2K852_9BRAS|nr:unnamed protein product [Microthlaspi erraticum]